MTTTKRPLRARSAKTAGSKPGPKRHSGRPKAQKPAKRESQVDRLIALLRRSGGVTMAEVAASLGILEPTARAMVSIHSRKRGFTVERLEGRRYRIAE